MTIAPRFARTLLRDVQVQPLEESGLGSIRMQVESQDE